MRNLFNIIRFEVVRSLKKPSFWIAAILAPACFVIYIMICAFAGYNTETSLQSNVSTDNLKIAYVDEVKYLEQTSFINDKENEQELIKYETVSDALSAIKEGEIDILYHIPANFKEEQKVQIYAKPKVSRITDSYEAPISALLSSSAASHVEEIDAKIIANQITYDTITFAEDNHEVTFQEKLSKIIAPGAALILFFVIIIVLSNRLSVAMTEEKENRISELLLVSIKPIELIVGKIVSLMIIGVIQLFVLGIPVIVLYLLASQRGMIPDMFKITFDLESALIFGALLIASYFLYTALYILIGTLVSTAKEASSFSGIFTIVMIIPLMMMNIFIDPTGSETLVGILSYFPLSAPLALMARAIFNNLETWELAIGIGVIVVTALILSRLAARIFCRNAVDFSFRNSFKNFGKTRKNWKE